MSDLWPIAVGNRWGYMDREGEVVIAPAFTLASPFCSGLAAVGVKRKWGYIDERGEVVIDLGYDSAGRFVDGLAPVSKGKARGWPRCWYIDRQGERVCGDYAGSSDFVEGRAVVDRYPDPRGLRHQALIEPAGREVVPFAAHSLGTPSEGTAVRMDAATRLCGYVDLDGKELFPPRWRSAGRFSEGLAVVAEDTGSSVATCVMDRAGREVWRLPVPYLEARPYREGLLLAPLDPADTFSKAFADHAGNVAIPASPLHSRDFVEGRAIIRGQGGLEGCIDRQGRIVVPPVLAALGDFDRGLARAHPFVDRPGVHGWIDLEGRWVWPRDARAAGFPELRA